VSLFHEIILRRIERDETAHTTAEIICTKLEASPLSGIGLRLVAPVRRGFEGYSEWAIDKAPNDLFFAGHSVLHRIDFDFKQRGLGSSEEIILRRLSEGSTIKILIQDPRSETVHHLAKRETQTLDSYLSDFACSLGVCQRLYDLLLNKSLPYPARLGVHIYNDIPFYAYHAVDEKALIGFYIYSALGFGSAVYEAVDQQSKKIFKEHFQSILNRSLDDYLIRTHPTSGKTELNTELFLELQKLLAEKLGETRTLEIMSGSFLTS
jgi:hypothetical protein